MHYPILISYPLSSEYESIINQEIWDVAHEKEPLTQDCRQFGFCVKNDHGRIIAGVYGRVFLGCVQIVNLWVDKEHRGQGYGKGLLNACENFGKENKATFVMLSSLQYFDALPFYQKQGYSLIFEAKGFQGGWSTYFFRKELV